MPPTPHGSEPAKFPFTVGHSGCGKTRSGASAFELVRINGRSTGGQNLNKCQFECR